MLESSDKIIFLGIVYLAFFAIEHFAPYFKDRQQHVRHSIRNLTLAAVNYVVAIGIFIFILARVFEWTAANKYGLLYALNLPEVYAYILAFVLIDLWQYIWHRMNHMIIFLWRFHQVHHADKEMDASTGIRFHTGEIIFSSLIRIAVIPLLGIQLNQLLMYELVLLPIILFHHSNIQLNEKIDRLMRIFIVTPHMHRLHHSDFKPETNSNYASVFSVWDRIFNSYTMRPIEYAFNLGLGKQFTSEQWNRFSGMIIIPFKKLPSYNE